jgi:hypothetical protein
LASHRTSVESCAAKFISAVKKRAQNLDARFPGSPFVRDLNFFGQYAVLITGPFGNFSKDFDVFVDLIAREWAMQTLNLRIFILALSSLLLHIDKLWCDVSACSPHVVGLDIFLIDGVTLLQTDHHRHFFCQKSAWK